MRISGRYIRIRSIPFKISQLVFSAVQIVILCKSPSRIINAYVFKKRIPATIKLRKGTIINLSDNQNDIVTFVTIFCKKEYGKIIKGQPVVDIGANIGLFTLYAAINGSSKIISVEPNAESFETLKKNIACNNLQNVVAIQKAVSAKTGDHLFIPLHSNPENICCKETEVANRENYVEVETVSLPDLLKQNNIDNAGLLKLDCEGAEYDILLPLTMQEMNPIQAVKMEYHAESRSLINHFLKNGFKITRLKSIINTGIKAGILEAVRL